MKQVHQLTAAEHRELDHLYKNGKKHHFRARCHCILLSNEGLSVSEISGRLKKQKDTVYTWMGRYESEGVRGLRNRPGQGARALLDSLSKKQESLLKKEVGNEPQNLGKVSGLLAQEFGFKVTKAMLARYLKKN